MDSRNYGSAFIQRLSADALQSTGVNHSYLQSFRDGDFPDFRLALQDFALQYGSYSACFSSYLAAVIDGLTDTRHRQILQSNLDEEQGHAHDHELAPTIAEIVAGQPHSTLFANFQRAVGIEPGVSQTTGPNQPGTLWSEQFLALCQRSACAGIGAIGIGTELIVSGIYEQVLAGMREHGGLSLQDRVFFELHSQCDDEHAEQLLQIAEELATSDAAVAEIDFGARMAIQLRTAFWDQMLNRARNISTGAPAIDTAVTNLGYETSL